VSTLTTLRRLLAATFVLLVATCLVDRLEVLRIARFQLERQDAVRPLWNTIVYLATYGLAVFGVAVAFCHRPVVRFAALGITLGAACVQAGVAAVNGLGFTHHEASLLLSESDFLGDALGFFLPEYLLAAITTLLGGALASWLALRVGPRLRSWAWLAFPLAALLTAHQVVDQTFGKVYQFPPPFRVALLAAWAWEHRLPVYAEREAPYFTPKEAPLTRHIVLVVDESISGHWLGANGAAIDTTPWLSSRPEGVFNYGIASSISNQSSSSNLLLQTGLRPADLPDRALRALRGPNLFSYLSAAGFETALIDAQTYSDSPPNLMTGYDLRRIDSVIRLRELEAGLPEHAVDFAALPRIVELLERHAKSFVYVIKTGAHFPYDDKSPPAQRPFSGGPASGREATRESYRNAIHWTTDRFLRELSRRIEATGLECLVIYTSDHGQWLPEESSEERAIARHATVIAPPSEQASVPLVLLGFGPRTRAALEDRYSAALVDAASGYAIFPTVLQAAGYSPSDTSAHYAPSLFEENAAEAPRTFVSGNIFGSHAGAFSNNPGVGDECFSNRFDVDAVRSAAP